MTFRVVRSNQYNQDLRLIHSTNGNHLESPNEGSSIDHQVTIYFHAQNITMFPTNETWEHCDVLSMQMDSDLVIYRTTLVRTFQVVTICRVEKSEVLVVLISPHYSKRH
ncbi:putative receptor-like protein kinase [Dorcoceras hygrometricum]|uniref:Putative receptor-like protein kinase n=1 Tax=Dorcoceras hygrometricum TaxID=472368 RepID=A0A2Z6ZUE3_9LAMI|nr:putative receptor-like protein kinase [Dorcoceras hygrometricum]